MAGQIGIDPGPPGVKAARDRPIVRAGAEGPVDLALVLATDCSSSVDAADFRLQMAGIAHALRNPMLAAAIASGLHGRIGLTLVQWSSRRKQSVTLPWRILIDLDDLDRAAGEVEATMRVWEPGGTGLAAAIDFSADILARLPFAAERLVIDVSGDGEENDGGDVATARDRAVRAGITINGLPITYGSRRLLTYYSTIVAGGPGAFVIAADTISDFRRAMTEKLLREVSSPSKAATIDAPPHTTERV
ncbi:MAG: DUF1194 domain-containing protein [Labrys sp. (in: a-proteobacteria)]|jgi:hypothetical protein